MKWKVSRQRVLPTHRRGVESGECEMMRRRSHTRYVAKPKVRRPAAIKMATLLVWLCMAGLIGCAHGPVKNPEATLRERAEKVWQGKVSGDCVAVYNGMSAQYRKMVSRDAFGTGCLKNRIEAFQITDIAMADDNTHAVVTVKFDTFQMGYLFKGAQLKEKWVKEGRQWVLDPRPAGKNPF